MNIHNKPSFAGCKGANKILLSQMLITHFNLFSYHFNIQKTARFH